MTQLKNNFVNSTLLRQIIIIMIIIIMIIQWLICWSAEFFAPFFSSGLVFFTWSFQAQQLVFQWNLDAADWKKTRQIIFRLSSFTHCIKYQLFIQNSRLDYSVSSNYDKAQSYEHICPCNCYTVLYISSSNRVLVLLTMTLHCFFGRHLFGCDFSTAIFL